VDQNQDYMDDVEDNIQNGFSQVFGWFLVINKISDNDFTKHEYVYKKNVLEVLNQLNYLVQWDQEQVRLMKIQQQKIS
jgi:hypothetical protein